MESWQIDATRNSLRNDSLLTRPDQQLVADLAQAQAKELTSQAFNSAQTERELALRTFPDRLAPGN